MSDLFQKKLPEIISVALSQNTLNGIEKILEVLSEAVDACGCVLWESEPFSNFRSEPPTGNLYVFAKWFRSEKMPLYKIPINGSANGYAIVNYAKPEAETFMVNGVLSIQDAKVSNTWTHKENYIVEKLNVTSMCIVPFCFNSREGRVNASLAVYRDREIKEFNLEEKDFIKTIAYLIPQLYEAICDKVGKRLLGRINRILDEIETKSKEDVPWVEEQIQKIKQPLYRICEEIADTLQCVEVSIFFENQFEIFRETDFKLSNNRKIKSVFKLFSTSFQEWTSAKTAYSSIKSDGLTAWALAEQEPIRIFNLSTFYQDKETLREQYVDIEWNDSLDFRSDAFKSKLHMMLNLPKYSNLEADENLPPLSFMAVPILKGRKTLGVIRCSVAKNTPWIFSDNHLEILESITFLISRFWSDFLIYLEQLNETTSWNNLIEKINNLNKKVQGKIDRLDFNEGELFRDILHITQDTFSDKDILDIRLLDKETNELYFAATQGLAWTFGSKKDRENRMNKRFSRNKSKKIFAFEVIETGNVKFINEVQKEPNYFFETFPQAQQMIIAPIGVADKNIGVLDIRRTTDEPFASNASIMAELIGRQLGLYLELREIENQQRRVFEDTWHQLKSPIRHTFARATVLLDHKGFENEPYHIDNQAAKEIVSELFMLRGVARKANKILLNAGIYVELATKSELKLVRDGTLLTFRDFRKMLSEVITDTKLMLEEYRNIRFYTNYESFERLDTTAVKVKLDFLEQALNCLLDNAGKYSYTDTVVKIYGGEEAIENQKYFFIAVENQGIVLDRSETKLIKRRKVRGQFAELTTGEGSGIGLWITDHIMKAHKGKVIIVPTDLKGFTIVKLLFPILT